MNLPLKRIESDKVTASHVLLKINPLECPLDEVIPMF